MKLALAGWKLEHGTLPEKLESLVGPFLKTMPLDPYAGEPFRYFPQGLPAPLYQIWKRVRRSAVSFDCTSKLNRSHSGPGMKRWYSKNDRHVAMLVMVMVTLSAARRSARALKEIRYH